MTCSTCKWWDSTGEELPKHPDEGFSWVFRPCFNDKLKIDGYTDNRENVPTDGAGPIWKNDDKYVYAFGPDFGCIHWEKKVEHIQ